MQAIERNGKKPDTKERGFYSESADIFDGVFWERHKSPSVLELEEMRETDPQAWSLFLATSLALRSAEPYVEAAEGGEAEAEFARSVFLEPESDRGMATPFALVDAQMTGALLRAKAFFEIVWAIEDGRYVVKKLAHRPAATCSVRTDGKSFMGFRQEAYLPSGPVKEDFDPLKSFVFIHGEEQKPFEGESAFIPVYHYHKHKQKVLWLAFTNLRLFALGVKHGKYGGAEGEAGMERFQKNLKTVEGGGTIVTGKDDEIDVLKSAGATQEFREVLNMLGAEQARAMALQWMMLGTDSQYGSRSLSEDHSDFFKLLLGAVQEEKAAAFNSQPMRHLIKLNFGENAKYPKLRYHHLNEAVAVRALEFLQTMLTATPQNPLSPGETEVLKKKAWPALDMDPEEVEQAEEKAEGEAPEAPEEEALPEEETPEPDGFRESVEALARITGGG